MTKTLNSTTNSTKTIKFLYSYGGKIAPRHNDGKLRYVGGHTRVLSVDRSVTFAELMVKFGESCGSSMNLKCKLPSEDLDLLVSVKSDEDLSNVIQEYDRVSPESKIVAVLSPIDSAKKVSPPISPISCFDFPVNSAKKPPSAAGYYASPPCVAAHRCCSPVVRYPIATAAAANYRCYEKRNPRQFFYVPHPNNSH